MIVTLADLQKDSRKPLAEWSVVPWAGCPDCEDSMYGPRVGPCGDLYADDPLVCVECGEVASVGMEDLGDDPHDTPQMWVRDDPPRALGIGDLAELRRVLGLGP